MELSPKVTTEPPNSNSYPHASGGGELHDGRIKSIGRTTLMGAIELCDGAVHDYQDIAALQTESWRSAYPGILPGTYLDGPILEERESHWQNLMRSTRGKRRAVFLAKDCGVLLGFACVLLDEEPAWGARLDNIHVRPAYRSKGTGRLLFSSAAKWISTCEPQWSMHLFVFEANHPARRFYEQMGGRVVERCGQMTPAGIVVPSLRFLWQNPRAIADL